MILKVLAVMGDQYHLNQEARVCLKEERNYLRVFFHDAK